MKKNSETQTDKPKYGKVKKEDHEKFFQRVAPKDIDPKANLAENMAEVEKLGGLFELIDPIETIYGPIGAFPMVPDAFPLHPSMCYFGQRRTGKSYTARDVASKIFRDIPFGIVLTMTIENGFWQQHVPKRFVVKGLRTDWMQGLLARQEKLIHKWKKDHPKECAEDPDAYKRAPELAAFIIFDDVISDRVAMQWNQQLLEFFVSGRHFCISTFITTQYPKGVGKHILFPHFCACADPTNRSKIINFVLHPYFPATSNTIVIRPHGERKYGRCVFAARVQKELSRHFMGFVW
jgi:hypothetical protein